MDAYDHKAAIYLLRARYEKDSRQYEEWFSNRFIPRNGEPSGSGGFDMFLCNGKPMETVVREALAHVGGDVMSKIVTSSRTCGIMPYVLGHGDGESKGVRQKSSALSYALLNKQFFADCEAMGAAFSYVEGVVRDEFVERALTVYRRGQPFFPCFTPIQVALNVEKGVAVALDRNLWDHYIYRFPAYFLHHEDLSRVMQSLVDAGKLSLATFLQHAGDSDAVQEMFGTGLIHFHKLKGLGNLLTMRGELPGACISGEELRAMLGVEVRDGPTLNLTPHQSWKESVDAMLVGVQPVTAPRTRAR
jgi:hypothetical protein